MIKILAIVGMAGVGKDTASEYLSKFNNWNMIHSYTNRAMREGETNGKEHIFVDYNAPKPEEMFAYTNYGGFDYWTTKKQFLKNTINIYVIDEDGLRWARDKARELGWNITALNITASSDKRKERGVSEDRMKRDETRNVGKIHYDYVIDNNGNLEDFYYQLSLVNV